MLTQIAGLLLIALFVPVEKPIKPGIPFGGADFKQYFTTSKLILEGHNPYDYEKAGILQKLLGNTGDTQVPYGPPTSLLPFIPLGWFDFHIAIQINLYVNLAMLILSCFLWGRLFLPQYPLVSVALLAVWVPSWTLLGLGQVSTWLLLGFTLWFWCMKQQRPVLAGMALTMTIIKPHLAFGLVLYALLYGIRHKQWRMIAAFFATIAVLIVLSFAIRHTIWMEYLGSLERSNPGQWFNATLDGWGRYTYGPRFSFVSGAWCLLLLQCIVLLAWLRPLQDRYGVLVLSLWLAASPYAFSYDFSLLLPAMVMAMGYTLQRKHRLALLAFFGWLLLALICIYCKSSWFEYQYFFIPGCGLLLTALLVVDRSDFPIKPISTESTSTTTAPA